MPPDAFFGQAQLQTQPAHFVLEQILERLDQLEAEFRRQAADVVVRLDGGGWAVLRGAAFDHVGIERSLGQEANVLDVSGLVS